MSKRKKHTVEEKLKILMEPEEGLESISSITYKYGISEYIFRHWRYRYEKYGIDGLKNSKPYKHYSKEQAVLEYLSGENSKEEIIKKYEISSRSVLSRWIKRYNSHRELKDTGKGMSKSMTWVRKFEIGGEEALEDKRGRNRLESELTEEDKIKLAIKRIEKENERLRAENAFLKKLQELEGRRY